MTAHLDLFVRNHLPPPELQPDFINLEAFSYPEILNCSDPLLDDAVKEGHGDRTAVIMDEGEWTYSDLQKEANRIAQVLTEDLKLVPGNRVLLRAPNCYAMLYTWFGVIKAGGIAVSTMPQLRSVELQTIINKARISLALCDRRLLEELKCIGKDSFLERLVSFNGGELEELGKEKSGEFKNLPTTRDDPCLIAFTSGTTGEPKAVVHTQQDMLSMCLAYSRNCLQPQPNDRFIGSPPLAFTFGLGGVGLFPLDARAATILIEQPTPGNLLAAAQRHRASVLFTSPTAYRFMLGDMGGTIPDSLRICVSAGETLPKPTFEEWKAMTGIEILDGIGSTEMLHIFISSRRDAIKPGSTGLPVPGYEARVVDDEMYEVPPGITGQLAVKGPTGCTYLEDKRQQIYVCDGWNLTGDSYQMDKDGYFWFQARIDDMIISGGYNIAGPEVEASLMAHPSVAECAVIGVEDKLRGQLVKAFVMLRSGFEGNDQLTGELQDFVKQNIAPYKYPRCIQYVEGLPKTETGKIQRFRLRQQEAV